MASQIMLLEILWQVEAHSLSAGLWVTVIRVRCNRRRPFFFFFCDQSSTCYDLAAFVGKRMYTMQPRDLPKRELQPFTSAGEAAPLDGGDLLAEGPK